MIPVKCLYSPVMSSCLCKQLEGAVFPLWIHPVKDREYDAIHTLHVDKANHRSSAATNLHETALDDVGGAQLSPQMSRELEERQQLRQVSLQLPHHPRPQRRKPRYK